MKRIVFFVAFTCCIAKGHADSIPLFNTGVDSSANLLSGGSADSHYLILETGSPALVINDVNIPANWIPDGPASKWIWQNANGTPTFVTRTFRTTFDLTGLHPSTASISGRWATDNAGLNILVNGVGTSQTSPGFGAFTPFSIPDNLLSSSLNTID